MKIGITTFYYKVHNYGANLQAYALCRVLGKMGHDAEQICFNTSDGFPEFKLSFPQNIIISIKVFIARILSVICHPRYYYCYKRRLSAVEYFLKDKIPHSKRVYALKNIKEAQHEYDLFITGSDVVWSPKTNSPIFFLRFLDHNKPKLAYAPSLGTEVLSKEEKKQFKHDLESFIDISTREKRVVPLLEEASGRKVSYCIDSTLLLDFADWNTICSKRIVNSSYVFCYFLGNNEEAKGFAIGYARSKSMRLVNIPYYWNYYSDFSNFGDVKLSDISAADFISLIKYADCVFTDSFHACVFSEIFSTPFFAVKRGKNDSLSVRLIDFLSETGLLSHYCDNRNKMTIDYVNKNLKIDFNQVQKRLEELREPSIKYLKDNIEFVCQKLNS